MAVDVILQHVVAHDGKADRELPAGRAMESQRTPLGPLTTTVMFVTIPCNDRHLTE
jgi:hypothetical protein